MHSDYYLNVKLALQKHNDDNYKYYHETIVGLKIYKNNYSTVMNKDVLNFIYKNDIMFCPYQRYYGTGSNRHYHNDDINKIFYVIIGYCPHINTIDGFIKIINDNKINDNYIIYILIYSRSINNKIIEYIKKYFRFIYIDILDETDSNFNLSCIKDFNLSCNNNINLSYNDNTFIFYRKFRKSKATGSERERGYNGYSIIRYYLCLAYKQIFYNKLLYTFIVLIIKL
jgi:hypothetical protein